MDTIVLEFSKEEIIKIEEILINSDGEDALRFFKEVIKPKLRSKRSNGLDMGKSIGVIT